VSKDLIKRLREQVPGGCECPLCRLLTEAADFLEKLDVAAPAVAVPLVCSVCGNRINSDAVQIGDGLCHWCAHKELPGVKKDLQSARMEASAAGQLASDRQAVIDEHVRKIEELKAVCNRLTLDYNALHRDCVQAAVWRDDLRKRLDKSATMAAVYQGERDRYIDRFTQVSKEKKALEARLAEFTDTVSAPEHERLKEQLRLNHERISRLENENAGLRRDRDLLSQSSAKKNQQLVRILAVAKE
jgi:uncharacterized protein (UPF0335 family)